jgi:hypothetical protein
MSNLFSSSNRLNFFQFKVLRNFNKPFLWAKIPKSRQVLFNLFNLKKIIFKSPKNLGKLLFVTCYRYFFVSEEVIKTGMKIQLRALF